MSYTIRSHCLFALPAKVFHVTVTYACLVTWLVICHVGIMCRVLTRGPRSTQPPVGSNTDVGEAQTRYQGVATLN